MTKELLQQALDALDSPMIKTHSALRKEIRMALAAPMPEPVAWLCENAVGHKYFRWKKPMGEYKPTPLYAAPPAAPAPATSADYAMGYAEGFEDACQVSAHVKAARESAPPVVREQLTNGEIYTAYIAATNQTLRPQDERLALAFARAIEKAHGIGGGK